MTSRIASADPPPPDVSDLDKNSAGVLDMLSHFPQQQGYCYCITESSFHIIHASNARIRILDSIDDWFHVSRIKFQSRKMQHIIEMQLLIGCKLRSGGVLTECELCEFLELCSFVMHVS